MYAIEEDVQGGDSNIAPYGMRGTHLCKACELAVAYGNKDARFYMNV